jgi:hypothetical protein
MWRVQMTPKTISTDQIKLRSLRRIEIHNSSSIEIFEKLKPNSLHEIKILNAPWQRHEIFTGNDFRCIPRILSQQVKLVSLEFSRISLFDFPESLKNWNWENLQKLVLNRVAFPTPEDFKIFAGFLKTLDKLTDLSLIVQKETTDDKFEAAQSVDEKQRKFTELVSELFSLPKLIKLEFGFDHKNQLGKIANLKVQNPGVQELTLKRVPADDDNKYGQFVKIFPNVRKATLDFSFPENRYQQEPDLTPINFWASLKELELSQATDNTLRQIKNLRSLKIDKNYDHYDESWNCFCQNNRQMERLEIGNEGYYFNKIAVIAEHLSNLKILILKSVWFPRCKNEPKPEIRLVDPF